MKISNEQLDIYRQYFTPIYASGSCINPIPRNKRVTVFFASGPIAYLRNVTGNEVDIRTALPVSWILEHELHIIHENRQVRHSSNGGNLQSIWDKQIEAEVTTQLNGDYSFTAKMELFKVYGELYRSGKVSWEKLQEIVKGLLLVSNAEIVAPCNSNGWMSFSDIFKLLMTEWDQNGSPELKSAIEKSPNNITENEI